MEDVLLNRNRLVITSTAVIGIIFVIVFYYYNNVINLDLSSAGVDKFGIRKIYRTKPGGEEWFMNMQNANSDPRFDPQATITKNPDGS